MKKVIAHLKSNALHYVMWIIFLGLVITIGSNGTLSKYATQFNGSTTVRTASFEIITDGESKSIALSKALPNNYYSFTIKSNSEVKVSYDIIITFENDLPEYISWYLDDNLTPYVNGNQYLFNDVGIIQSGDNELKTHKLHFMLNNEEYASVSGVEISIEGINIKIIATQIL